MGDLEYSPHPAPLVLEEDDNRDSRDLLAVTVPTSGGSESPSTTPLVRMSMSNSLSSSDHQVSKFSL